MPPALEQTGLLDDAFEALLTGWDFGLDLGVLKRDPRPPRASCWPATCLWIVSRITHVLATFYFDSPNCRSHVPIRAS